jgi:hypothetical protein
VDQVDEVLGYRRLVGEIKENIKGKSSIKALSTIGQKGKDGREAEEVSHIATN